MGDNSVKMTLEEKLVQHIKDIGLGALITDEDAITSLTQRALHEALFQPRRIPDRYGSINTYDSPVVAAARKISEDAVTKLTETVFKELLENEEVKNAMKEALSLAIPMAIQKYAENSITNFVTVGYLNSQEKIQNLIKNMPFQFPG